MDLLFRYINLYNTVFKLLFILSTAYVIYLIRFQRPYCIGYDAQVDSFNHYLIIYPIVIVLTIFFHVSIIKTKYFYDYFWSFSVWLEAFAIIPQLYIVYKKREVEIITGSYMACLGIYKVFYIMSWIYMYFDKHNLILIKFIAGVIQIAIYFDYLYFYFVSAKVSSNRIKLPV